MQVKNVIDEFVNDWEQKALSYYLRGIEDYRIMEIEHNKIDNPTNLCCPPITSERMAHFKSRENWILGKFGKNYDVNNAIRSGNEEYLRKMVHKEALAKKEKFMMDIGKKAGNIVDGRLYIDNGDINGTVVGDKATVNVRTISAGGYNIQCFHYRTLVKVI